MIQTPVEPGPTRFRVLDGLRGFALTGILLVNGLDITGQGTRAADVAADPVRAVLYLTVQTRFVPIFAFLFGVSLWLVLAGARTRTRTAHPVIPVVRRLLTLGVAGWLLALAYPGNILLEYAIWAIPALIAAVLLPARIVLATGGVLTIATYTLFGGGEPTTPALIMAGTGAAALGLPRALEHPTRRVAFVLGVAAVATVPALAAQLGSPGDPRFTIGGVAGVITAVVYTAGFALLWQTRARRVLAAVFEPLGRMALTNYIGAALVFALLTQVINFTTLPSAAPVVGCSLLVIALQSVSSRLWLQRMRYGPFEWLWRTATWCRPVPMLRSPRRRSALPAAP